MGIDPGITGAVAVLKPDGSIFAVIDEFTRSPHEIAAHLKSYKHFQLKAALEQGQPFPGQGVSSTFKNGLSCGWYEGILAALAISYELVRPAVWQKVVGGRKPKKATKKQIKEWVKDACLRRWPGESDLFVGPRGGIKDGRCDALMIAEWLRLREINGLSSD